MNIFQKLFYKPGKITKFMLVEHKKIFELLGDFEKHISESNSEAYLAKLVEKQGSHAFSEEKAIMIFYKNNKNFPEIVQILKEHEELKNIISRLTGKNKSSYKNNFKNLRELLIKHIKLENETFYPKLDKELNEAEKAKIFNRLNKYILGNIALK